MCNLIWNWIRVLMGCESSQKNRCAVWDFIEYASQKLKKSVNQVELSCGLILPNPNSS